MRCCRPPPPSPSPPPPKPPQPQPRPLLPDDEFEGEEGEWEDYEAEDAKFVPYEQQLDAGPTVAVVSALHTGAPLVIDAKMQALREIRAAPITVIVGLLAFGALALLLLALAFVGAYRITRWWIKATHLPDLTDIDEQYTGAHTALRKHCTASDTTFDKSLSNE